MGGLFSKPKAPAPTAVPSADPSTVQANFVADEAETEKDLVSKNKSGKSSLKVARPKNASVSTASTSSGSGLAVGK